MGALHVSTLGAAPPTFVGLMGGPVPVSITGLTPHAWAADPSGLYHTSSDLAAEWQSNYAAIMSGAAGSLTGVQRLEGQAEAVFANTGLSKLDPAAQARDREDLQREFDALQGAMTLAGVTSAKPLSATDYQVVEHTLQANAALEELGIQGHGLTAPPSSRYGGYEADIQAGAADATLYVGPGAGHGTSAVAAYLGNVVLGYAPFPTVYINGHLDQLNQNGRANEQVGQAVANYNNAAFGHVDVAKDFALPPPPKPVAPPHAGSTSTGSHVATPPSPAATPGFQKAYDGELVPTTIGSADLAHTWTADATGAYYTSTDLLAEWRGDYTAMLDGRAATLTAEQRLEGNAEALFENTGLGKLAPDVQARDRQELQRFFDAEGAAMSIDQRTLGIDPTKPFTEQTYLALEHAIQTNPELEELAIQGHGLNNPSAAKYRGYTEDIQNVVDNRTRFVGGGLDSGEKAIADFMDDVILGHAAFPAVFINGTYEQLNQNGAAEDPVSNAFAGLNEAAYTRVFTARDFKA